MVDHRSAIPTAPAVAAGLVGGFAAARYSGRRELGGVVLAGAGIWCARSWARSSGAAYALADRTDTSF